ncbi:MAG TPA: bifunctional hydroxymethylpyrimidine kinase/phosphomethylpyrimidine kinase [Kiritimatiellia bacterium]|nr:bifunctional hydroxymethylpyrimidine kinase/phosphomethylpyrimidine kinase [Kiritimatiellia bacterium]HRZ11002.1 bifunctional hydroxymethylpyrimidine kinase/phosphomethylpyrimidine kinase [Kiritimatiellia bacterium]HSA18575.1 bifunctional hydroxymethylpyrimidine kinase/phosphomethylpyrimidine kinase [Kiritimatiellia bacterium]
MKPIVWTVAGTDPGGGAGIQGDLATLNGLGVHGGSVITAVIAQNTLGVQRVEFAPADLVAAQLDSLREDLPPAAIKIGMLGTAGAARAVARVIRDLDAFVVYDPVMGSSSGHGLMAPDLLPAVIEDVLPLVDLLTPNLPEAQRLTGRAARAAEDLPHVAGALLALGARTVLLKGGHSDNREYCQDFWTDGKVSWWITSPRQAVRHTHGTGCTFSSAAAACLARGYAIEDALVLAKAYVNQGLRLGGGIGRGRGPLAHEGWPNHPDDAPWMTAHAAAGLSRPAFPPCEKPVGLYPIVDRAAWIGKLAPLGVNLVQLRAKDLSGEALDREAREAIRLARAAGVRLVINDRADLALRHGAWGIHLGQDDLPGADLAAIEKAGLRLGVSASSYADMARALALRPSYIGLGAVYATATKAIGYAPLGVESFGRLRSWSSAPVVAIGGITVENARPLRDAGADGVAVISDLRDAADLAARVRAWQAVI